MPSTAYLALPLGLAATLLAACGGGGDHHEDAPPSPAALRLACPALTTATIDPTAIGLPSGRGRVTARRWCPPVRRRRRTARCVANSLPSLPAPTRSASS